MSAGRIDTVVLTVGNNMMGDDGAGPHLHELLEQRPIQNWLSIDGGAVPENEVDRIADLKPHRLFIVDAADMALAPGEVRILDEDAIADMFIMTTHNLPLTFLIDRVKTQVEEVVFIGIQPDLVSFGFPMSDPVKLAVEKVYRHFVEWSQRNSDPLR